MNLEQLLVSSFWYYYLGGLSAPNILDVYAEAGVPKSVTFREATGPAPPFTYALSALPTGWTFDETTRILAGDTTTVVGSDEITLTVTDAEGEMALERFRIIVHDPLTDFDPDDFDGGDFG